MIEQDPKEWYEFAVLIFQDRHSPQWVAEVTYGHHPDLMERKTYKHPKLEIVRGMSHAFVLRLVAQVTKEGPQEWRKYDPDNPDQIPF